MKTSKILTLTVGITAYNEAETIKRMLRSILAQKEISFKLEKIIVVSDGSSDLTVRKAGEIKDKRLKIINDSVNKGQNYRWNQIFKIANSDVVVLMDADEELTNNFSLANLIFEFGSGSNVALVGGNPYSVSDNSFLARCLDVTRNAYTDIRYKIKDGNNIFGCMGGMIALSKKLYKKIKIPSDVSANDSYTYLKCMKLGYEFRNAKNVSIAHYQPFSLKGHLKRTTRHSKSRQELQKYFGVLTEKEFYMPKDLYIKAALKQFIKYPVHTAVVYMLNSYARYLSRHSK